METQPTTGRAGHYGRVALALTIGVPLLVLLVGLGLASGVDSDGVFLIGLTVWTVAAVVLGIVVSGCYIMFDQTVGAKLRARR
jgi:NhaP-type Na+/H+ and K+/H+ antiporter